MRIEIYCETDQIIHKDEFSGSDLVLTTKGLKEARDVDIGESLVISKSFSLKGTKLVTHFGREDGC